MAQDDDTGGIDPSAALAALMTYGTIAEQWTTIRRAREYGIPAHIANVLEDEFTKVVELYLGFTDGEE
jgi:hypothetical protein